MYTESCITDYLQRGGSNFDEQAHNYYRIRAGTRSNFDPLSPPAARYWSNTGQRSNVATSHLIKRKDGIDQGCRCTLEAAHLPPRRNFKQERMHNFCRHHQFLQCRSKRFQQVRHLHSLRSGSRHAQLQQHHCGPAAGNTYTTASTRLDFSRPSNVNFTSTS